MRAGSRRGSADGLLVEQFVITFAVSTEFDEPERILRKRKEGPRQAQFAGRRSGKRRCGQAERRDSVNAAISQALNDAKANVSKGASDPNYQKSISNLTEAVKKQCPNL